MPGREPRGTADEARRSRSMRRLEALEAIYPRLKDSIVVTIMGAVAAELQSLGHQPNFFYLQHAMGMASSIGLGIALSRPELRVVVLDGDGSVLMNLGGLATLARCRPPNLLQLIFDNESFVSVGGFPTATAMGCDLAAIAHSSGVPRSLTVETVEELVEAVDQAFESRELTTLVAKVDAHYRPPGEASGFVTSLGLLENRYQFQQYLKDHGKPANRSESP